MMAKELTPEFKAKLQAILNRPEPSKDEQIAVLQRLLADLCDTLERYEDQLLVQSYVITMHHGGLTLVAERLEIEDRLDLLPRIQAAFIADNKVLFPQ